MLFADALIMNTIASRYDFSVINDISVFYAPKSAERLSYNALYKKDAIICRLLEIGAFLEKVIDDNDYIPFRAHDIFCIIAMKIAAKWITLTAIVFFSNARTQRRISSAWHISF